jgi:hypothetical protein
MTALLRTHVAFLTTSVRLIRYKRAMDMSQNVNMEYVSLPHGKIRQRGLDSRDITPYDAHIRGLIITEKFSAIQYRHNPQDLQANTNYMCVTWYCTKNV